MKFHLILFIFCIKLLNAQECGVVKVAVPFIAGGDYAERGQWPWLAPLFLKEKDKFFCGSTIISKRHLLSASHCMKPKGSSSTLKLDSFYTLIGKFNLKDSDEPGVVESYFVSIKIHPDWKPLAETYDGDVALLKLKSDITFTNFIQPACLPTITTQVFEVDGFVAGYGFTEDTVEEVAESLPKFVNIESVTQETCLFSHEVISRISSPRMFCAGKRGKNPCKGDSGGGFYIKNGNRYSVIGVVSSSIHRECGDNQYVLFTNIPKFLAWINHEMADSNTEDDNWTLTSLKCSFEDNKPHDQYECFSEFSLQSTTPNVRISNIEGSFTDGKNYSDVNTIIIKAAKVTYIPDMTAANNKFPNFQKLFIVLCGLKHVERSKLSKITQLKTLNFYGNEIEYFSSDVFDDLKNLEILAFVNNKIKVLPSRLLWNLVNLKEIWSYTNPIEAIPIRFFANNKNLEKAWMGYSKIKKIGVNFKALPNLNLLDLRENTCIDEQGCTNCAKSIEKVQDIIDEKC